MLITIKDLQHSTWFRVDIDTNVDTVAILKASIQRIRGSERAPIAQQCLFYAGRILKDQHPLAEYTLDQSKFIVLLVRSAQKDEVSQDNGNVIFVRNSNKTEPTTDVNNTASNATTVAGSFAPDPKSKPLNLLAVAHIVEMGYTWPEAVDALRMCHDHYEYAVEYLLTGELPLRTIDEHNHSDDDNVNAANRPVFLRYHPDIIRMQRLVYDDPLSLNQYIDQLETDNAELFHLIGDNMRSLVELLLDPLNA